MNCVLQEVAELYKIGIKSICLQKCANYKTFLLSKYSLCDAELWVQGSEPGAQGHLRQRPVSV